MTMGLGLLYGGLRLDEDDEVVTTTHDFYSTHAALSAGIVCFEVEGRNAFDVVERLYARNRIVASLTPYVARYVRLGPSILNTRAEVDRVVRAVASV